MNHPVILSLIGAWLFATTTAHAAPDRVMTVKASVDGMVCSFCAQGIVAHFKKHKAVSNVHVDLTRKLVILEEKKGSSISDQEITEFIKKSGFAPKKVERSTESFSKVKAAGK
jgi:mercuric ion binding protein